MQANVNFLLWIIINKCYFHFLFILKMQSEHKTIDVFTPTKCTTCLMLHISLVYVFVVSCSLQSFIINLSHNKHLVLEAPKEDWQDAPAEILRHSCTH